jgi:hypothetical protein
MHDAGFEAATLASRRQGLDNRQFPHGNEQSPMARWPRHVWTTLFTYLAVFGGFPLLCWLASRWVRGQ